MATQTEYSDKVLRQQEAVRDSGLVNMFDKQGVRDAADQMGFDELVAVLDDVDGGEYIALAEASAAEYR